MHTSSNYDHPCAPSFARRKAVVSVASFRLARCECRWPEPPHLDRYVCNGIAQHLMQPEPVVDELTPDEPALALERSEIVGHGNVIDAID